MYSNANNDQVLNDRLMQSIIKDELENVKILLRCYRFDPNVKFKDIPNASNNIPAICLSVKKGFFNMTKLLIKNGFNLNETDNCGLTALHFAVDNQHKDMVKFLLSQKIDIDFSSNFGETSLHIASEKHSLEICKYLITAGCNLEKKDYMERTPLMKACMFNQVNIAKYLIRSGANINTLDKDGNSPLIHSLEYSLCPNAKMVKILLEAGAEPNHKNSFGQTPLFIALRRLSDNFSECQIIIQSLINYNCNIDEREYGSIGELPIHYAITNNQDLIIEMLIKSGCDLNVKSSLGYLPLQRLFYEKKLDLIKLILSLESTIPKLKDIFYNKEKIDEVNELLKYLFAQGFFSLSLKRLCRAKLRKSLGRFADFTIKSLDIPLCIKRYLLLKDL